MKKYVVLFSTVLAIGTTGVAAIATTTTNANAAVSTKADTTAGAVIYYVDVNGVQIPGSEYKTLTGKAGDTSVIDTPAIAGYKLLSPSGQIATYRGVTTGGTINDGFNMYTVVYVKTDGDKNKTGILVNSVDTDGNALSDLVAPNAVAGNVGDTYKITPRQYTGYTLETPASELTGTFTADKTNVTLTYKKDAAATKTIVSVDYIDEYGIVIHPSQQFQVTTGTTFDLDPVAIDGYKLSESYGDVNPLKGYKAEGKDLHIQIQYDKVTSGGGDESNGSGSGSSSESNGSGSSSESNGSSSESNGSSSESNGSGSSSSSSTPGSTNGNSNDSTGGGTSVSTDNGSNNGGSTGNTNGTASATGDESTVVQKTGYRDNINKAGAFTAVLAAMAVAFGAFWQVSKRKKATDENK